MTLLRCLLNVLRIMIQAADDDQVLQTSRDIKLIIVQETEIARAQIPLFSAAGEKRAKRFRRRLRLIPIPTRDTRPGNPNLSHLIARTNGIGLRIYNDHLLLAERNPTTNVKLIL